MPSCHTPIPSQLISSHPTARLWTTGQALTRQLLKLLARDGGAEVAVLPQLLHRDGRLGVGAQDLLGACHLAAGREEATGVRRYAQGAGVVVWKVREISERSESSCLHACNHDAPPQSSVPCRPSCQCVCRRLTCLRSLAMARGTVRTSWPPPSCLLNSSAKCSISTAAGCGQAGWEPGPSSPLPTPSQARGRRHQTSATDRWEAYWNCGRKARPLKLGLRPTLSAPHCSPSSRCSPPRFSRHTTSRTSNWLMLAPCTQAPPRRSQ